MNKLLKNTIINTGALLGTAFIGLGAVAMAKKGDSQYANELEQKNPMEGKAVIFIEDQDDQENADGFRGHLEAVGDLSLTVITDEPAFSPLIVREHEVVLGIQSPQVQLALLLSML